MQLQGLTVALVLLAATAFELAQFDRGSSLLPIAGSAAIEAAVMLAAAGVLSSRESPEGRSTDHLAHIDRCGRADIRLGAVQPLDVRRREAV